MVGHMHNYGYEPEDLHIVRGPAAVLGLDTEAVGRLAVAYLSNK